MPLNQLTKLTLKIDELVNNDDPYLKGNEIKCLFDQYLPKLRHFNCSIQTKSHLDIKSFELLNQQWPMKFRLESTNSFAHFYTVPWSFESLYLSMLSIDDQHIIHANIRSLIIHNSFVFRSSRFPNVHTLYINIFSHLSLDNFQGFTRLRTLTVNHINLVPNYVIQRLHTLILFQIEDLLNDETYFHNLDYLVNEKSFSNLLFLRIN
ncbi:unnamed protein product [Adineta ricciae]|uniref:Uncharacterized protein n=1 Tax=Adineta ricciae TaxID=249248 RepID=A0A815PME5_ADIRI|nr:unnamed protein product [Adineta ricciae]CAF1451211.1 unnamed protein product [Adineta ricciae]